MSFPASVYFWRFFEWQAALKHSYRNLKAFFRAFFARQEGLERKKKAGPGSLPGATQPGARDPPAGSEKRRLLISKPSQTEAAEFFAQTKLSLLPPRLPGKGTGNGKRRKNAVRLALTNHIGEKILNPRTIELVMSYAMCKLYHISRKKVNCFLKKHFPLSTEGI